MYIKRTIYFDGTRTDLNVRDEHRRLILKRSNAFKIPL